LFVLGISFEADHPGAAYSVLKGLDETLALQKLEASGALYKKRDQAVTVIEQEQETKTNRVA
jgi:hypothetical protein